MGDVIFRDARTVWVVCLLLSKQAPISVNVIIMNPRKICNVCDCCWGEELFLIDVTKYKLSVGAIFTSRDCVYDLLYLSYRCDKSQSSFRGLVVFREKFNIWCLRPSIQFTWIDYVNDLLYHIDVINPKINLCGLAVFREKFNIWWRLYSSLLILSESVHFFIIHNGFLACWLEWFLRIKASFSNDLSVCPNMFWCLPVRGRLYRSKNCLREMGRTASTAGTSSWTCCRTWTRRKCWTRTMKKNGKDTVVLTTTRASP